MTSLLQEFIGGNLIIPGDFNTYLDPKLDKKGGTTERQSNYLKAVNAFCEQLSLIYIWRLRNPEQSKFTRRNCTRAGLVQSRLDYFFISTQIGNQISKCAIKPGFKSDHSLLQISFDLLHTQMRGGSYWKFNNSLLDDNTYIAMIKDEIKTICQTTHMEDKNTLWEFVKCQIRTATISYTKAVSRRNREKERRLEKKLEILENSLAENGPNAEYRIAKIEWEQLQAKKSESAIFRSKAKWVESGEKNTKFFFNLEKQNYNARYIKKLITHTGTGVTKPEDILEEEKHFYKSLYTTNITSEDSSSEFSSSKNIPKLNSLDQQICDSPIKLDEIAEAIKTLKNDKSPGNDGFTTNFYKFFWPDIKLLLYDSFKYSFETKMLSDNQRRGILNLIPKPNKDLRYLKNWRPISILNTDYKILTKILSSRLQSVLPLLISNDQVGYIKDRNITENVRIIEDIMSYTAIKKIPGLILLVDFEKAFDSVEWPFLFKTLKNFNFGKNFIQWVKILYTNILSCVGNNGYYSNYFELSRGIRQGCPLSALLFILVVEVMAIEIRNNDKVQGIVVGKTIFKICQLADDTTLFLDNVESIIQAVKIFQKFKKFSGLNMNLEKSEVIPIGTLKLKEVILPKCVSKLVVNRTAFKTLGIYFSHDINESVNLNFEPKLNAMETIMNIWSARKLSLKGKVLIIKHLYSRK